MTDSTKKKQKRNLSPKKDILLFLVPLLICFLVFFLVYGCSSIKTTGEDFIAASDQAVEINNSKKINIASLKGPSSIGMVKLHNERPSISNGTEVNYEIIPSPDIMISKLLSDEIDMATLPTNVAAKLFNKGIDIKIVAIVGYGVLYLVYQDIEFDDWNDLSGNTINVTSKGSTPDVILRLLLESKGLKPEKDIQIDYSQEQTELSQLFIAGKVTLAVLPEPFVTMVLSKNDNSLIAFDIEEEWKKNQNGLSLPMTCLIADREVIENNHEAMSELLQLYKGSINWVNTNPEDAAGLIQMLDIGMDKEIALEAIPRCNIRYCTAKEAQEDVTNYLKAIFDFSPDDIGGEIPGKEFYYE
jgi:NitT/TauT family transport system substrate-binding protein